MRTILRTVITENPAARQKRGKKRKTCDWCYWFLRKRGYKRVPKHKAPKLPVIMSNKVGVYFFLFFFFFCMLTDFSSGPPHLRSLADTYYASIRCDFPHWIVLRQANSTSNCLRVEKSPGLLQATQCPGDAPGFAIDVDFCRPHQQEVPLRNGRAPPSREREAAASVDGDFPSSSPPPEACGSRREGLPQCSLHF